MIMVIGIGLIPLLESRPVNTNTNTAESVTGKTVF